MFLGFISLTNHPNLQLKVDRIRESEGTRRERKNLFDKKGQHCDHNNGQQLIHFNDQWWRTKIETIDYNERRLTATNTSSADQQLLSTPNAECGPCSAEISAKRTPKTSFSKQDRHWNMLCNLFALFLLISYLLFQVPIVHSLIFEFYRSVFAQDHSLFKHISI